MELIAVSTDIPIIGEGEDSSVDHIKDILLHHLNSHKIKNKDLNDKINVLEEKLDAQKRDETLSGFQEYEGNIEDLQKRNEKLKNKVYSLETDIQEKVTMIAYLEKKFDVMRGAAANSTSVTETKERYLQGLEATIEEQSKKLSVNINALDQLRQYVVEAERKASASSLLKAEQEALLFSLRKDLKAALQFKVDNEKAVRELTEYRFRTEGKLCSLVENKDKLFQSQADLDEANALIKRLESRLHIAETNLAVRTAGMASAEEQVASLQVLFKIKQKDLEQAVKASHCLKQQLFDVEEKASWERKKHVEKITAKQFELDAVINVHEEEMASRQIAFAASIDEMEKDVTRRGQVAQQLLEEKVSTIRKLTEDNISLKEEVESG